MTPRPLQAEQPMKPVTIELCWKEIESLCAALAERTRERNRLHVECIELIEQRYARDAELARLREKATEAERLLLAVQDEVSISSPLEDRIRVHLSALAAANAKEGGR